MVCLAAPPCVDQQDSVLLMLSLGLKLGSMRGKAVELILTNAAECSFKVCHSGRHHKNNKAQGFDSSPTFSSFIAILAQSYLSFQMANCSPEVLSLARSEDIRDHSLCRRVISHFLLSLRLLFSSTCCRAFTPPSGRLSDKPSSLTSAPLSSS